MWTILIYFLFIGLVVTYFLIKSGHDKTCKLREKEILKLIISKGGRITPLEIAAETDHSVGEVKAALDRLCYEGFGKLELTDDGILVYIFESVQSLEEKNSDIVKTDSK